MGIPLSDYRAPRDLDRELEIADEKADHENDVARESDPDTQFDGWPPSTDSLEAMAKESDREGDASMRMLSTVMWLAAGIALLLIVAWLCSKW